MTTPDIFCLALIAVLLLLDYFVLWPTFLRQSHGNPTRARLWLWSSWMIMLWALVAAIVLLWLFEARSWGALRLVMPHGWRLWGSVGLVLVLAISYARIVVRLAWRSRSRRIKINNPQLVLLAPHTPSELAWWAAVSLSAGFCEELIFRGYLIWAFQPTFGLWGAAIFSLFVFAAAHAYQGAKNALVAGLIGGVLTLVVLISGSLWPAIALHALVDFGQNLIGWLAIRRVQDERSTVLA